MAVRMYSCKSQGEHWSKAEMQMVEVVAALLVLLPLRQSDVKDAWLRCRCPPDLHITLPLLLVPYQNCQQFRNVIIVHIPSTQLGGITSSVCNSWCKFPQAARVLCARLVQDTRKHFSSLFHFGVTSDGECVGGRRGLNLGVVEVDHPPILPDHVHLFSAWGRADRQLLLLFFNTKEEEKNSANSCRLCLLFCGWPCSFF